MKSKLIDLLEKETAIEGLQLERNTDLQFGDFKSNYALVVAKKEGKNPQEVAHEIVGKIKKDLFEKVEVAGPGFINFYLKKEFVVDMVDLTGSDEYGKRLLEYGEGKVMVIDYSAPNIAKPFGIGHLRSTNIGQAIYNLYKKTGWKTIGDNHIGDWGTQFGKLIVAIQKFATKKPEELTIDDMEKLYIDFHKRAEGEEGLVEEARQAFAKLEKGDSDIRTLWQLCVDLSMKEHQKVYDLLGVKIDYVHGEAFYEDMMSAVVEECRAKGIATTGEGGALIVEFGDMPPAMLLKSNGTTTYFTRDLATVSYRKDAWKPNLVIYEVGADQSLHLRQVFETTKKLGWYPEGGMVHVAHGLIRWKDGKFSTRRGETIHLSDVIDKAMEEAKKITESAHVQKHTSEEKDKVIKSVAIGAVKFADLLSDPRKDIIFDWDRVMSVDGDSGPYVQYTYARGKSVLEKSTKKPDKKLSSKLSKPEEYLLRILLCLEEKILEAASRNSPSVICTYALLVARSYNEFYGTTQIIGSENEEFKLWLSERTSVVLSECMEILGITVIERL